MIAPCAVTWRPSFPVNSDQSNTVVLNRGDSNPEVDLLKSRVEELVEKLTKSELKGEGGAEMVIRFDKMGHRKGAELARENIFM
jgi:hypothetical protein